MDELEVMAKTLYGEARGEKSEGMEAVANVIVNRAKNPCWWGTDIKSVCLKPQQFSCWNENDPNSRILARDLSGDVVYGVCLNVAKRAIAGVLRDNTHGATHYHTKAVKPKWAEFQAPCAVIGNHLFYKDIG